MDSNLKNSDGDKEIKVAIIILVLQWYFWFALQCTWQY